MPFFSIVMPVFNTEKFIAAAIDSVIAQSDSDWELILVDDGSTDQSSDICMQYSRRDDRIKFISIRENRGPGFARNLGAKHAKGEWLAILDSDDLFMPEKLGGIRKVISAWPRGTLALVGSGCTVFHELPDNPTKVFIYPADSRKLKRNLVNAGRFPPHSSICYNLCFFQRIGGFNELFQRAQDFDLWLRMSILGEFTSVNEVLIAYRAHSNSITHVQCKNGFLQQEYIYAARICFSLREQKIEDPSVSEQSFRILLRMVSSYYRGSVYHRSRKVLEELKKTIACKRGVLLILRAFLAASPFLLHLSMERRGILSFERKILRKWVIKSDVKNES